MTKEKEVLQGAADAATAALLRRLIELCYSYGEDKPGLNDRKRPALCNGCEAEAWWRPGDGWVLWDGQSHDRACPVGQAEVTLSVA